MTEPSETPITSLLDAALDAIERGDTSSGVESATEVLRRDPTNAVARRLIEEAGVAPGEMRRLAMMFVDLVGSTSLSTRLDTASYRRIVRRYHRECELAITDHGGRIARKTGDGVLAFFGHPTSHEDDTARAVRAGLSVVRRMTAVRPDIEREFGELISVRVAVHLGPVHLDLIDSEIYGLAPNLAARIQDLAAPDTVAVSDAVAELVGRLFELEDLGFRTVKGVDEPIRVHTVVAERPEDPLARASTNAPYVNRIRELDGIVEVVTNDDDAAEETVMVVRGEPGMGKTRIVLEALSRTDEPNRRVLWIICSEYERSNDFGAAAALLRLEPAISSLQGPAERLSQLTRHLGTLGLDLDTNVPLLAPLLGVGPEVGYTPAESDITVLRAEILRALRDWLEALADRSQVVVAVDDLQWADASTIELLAGLASDPIAGVRVLATERAGGARLGGPGVRSVDLEPLPLTEATRLAHTVGGELRDEALATVLDRGQGNPLFLQELARMGDAPSPDIGPEAMSRLSTWSVVPRALYEPLLARLYHGDTDIGLAQAAATIGRSFHVETLERVSNRPRDLVRDGLGTLIDAGLVERDDAHDLYWFRHVLIRDVAYDLMPEEQRELIHGRVADALRAERESGRQVAWSTIATHLRAAQRGGDAADAFESAADEARERGALEQGVEHLAAAIELLEDGGNAESVRLRIAEVRLRRAFLCVSQNGNTDPRAEEDYEACLHLTASHDTGPEFVGTLVALYSYYAARGEMGRAEEMITRIRATGITDDPDMMDESYASEGIVRWFQGDFLSAERCFEHSHERAPGLITTDRELSRWQIPQDPGAATELHMALSRWQMGDAMGFGEHARRATRRTQNLPFPHGPFTSLYVLVYKVLVLNEMGRWDRAETEIRIGSELVEAHHLAFWPISLDVAGAVNEARRLIDGGPTDVDRLIELGGRLGGGALLFRMGGAMVIVPYVLTNQAATVLAAGDLVGARAALDDAVSVANESGCHWYTAETHRIRAQLLEAEGATADEVVAELRAAASLARRQGSVPFEMRALVDLGRAGVAESRLDELVAIPGARVSAGLDDTRSTSDTAAVP